MDDPVRKYLPNAPAAWDRITVGHALSQTAGIPNYTSFPGFATMQPFPITAEKIVEAVSGKPLDFEPGAKFAYSNSNYVVLGYLIEIIAAKTYGEFVQDNIFAPLGMKDSGYDSNAAIIERRASGYSHDAQGLTINADFIHMTVPHAAGGLYSTTEDLLRWELGLFGGKLLESPSLQRMITPTAEGNALGLVIRELDGLKHLWAVGGINGFSASMAWYPASQVTVVVLANLSGWGTEHVYPQLALAAHGRRITLAAST